MADAGEVEKKPETTTTTTTTPSTGGVWGGEGLFGCVKDPFGCIASAVCDCLVHAKNAEEVDSIDCGPGFLGKYWDHACAVGCTGMGGFCIFQTAKDALKKHGAVELNATQNRTLCLETCCCAPCVTCRTRRFLDAKESRKGGFDPMRFGPNKGSESKAPDKSSA